MKQSKKLIEAALPREVINEAVKREKTILAAVCPVIWSRRFDGVLYRRKGSTGICINLCHKFQHYTFLNYSAGV